MLQKDQTCRAGNTAIADCFLKHNRDFPAPVPGIYGQAPYVFTGDLRVRVSRQILLDLTRQYFFNFAGERWAPQFSIQFSP